MTPRLSSSCLAAGIVLIAAVLFAADNAGKGRLLLEEHFNAPTLPSTWTPGGRPNSFSIADGALQASALPDDSHGPSIGVPLKGQNFTVTFRMKFTKPGYFLFLIDGETPFGEVDHLLRFVLTDSHAQLAQDRGTLKSKMAQAKQRAKAGGKLVPGTKGQLADPEFHRTEMLAKESTKIAGGGWHEVLIEQRGNEVRAQVDDLLVLRGNGTVIDGKKSRIVFLIGNAGTVLVDDVRVWENEAEP
ncbi:MAG: hypothetical protein U0984_20105 [Prosthecobacter sp.]|nr:hypothetical protein [Prosthecobacter sp.]